MILYINSKDREAQEQKMQRFKNDLERYYHEQRKDAYNQYKNKVMNKREVGGEDGWPLGQPIDLFQTGNFVSHAGLNLTWKIEMDAISDAEWECLAKMILEIEHRPFRAATGIPRGGVALGVALNQHATGNDNDPLLIVDDVWTTGTSFREIVEHPDMKEWIGVHSLYDPWQSANWFGWVVFARTPTIKPIRALFEMAVPDSYYEV